MLGLTFLLERGRDSWDADRKPRAKAKPAPFAGIGMAWRHVPLRLLSLAGACFVIVQICLSTFTVVLFVEDMHYGLVQAGMVLMSAQAGGVGGRVFWGWLADLTRNCFAVLAVAAGVLTATCLTLIATSAHTPFFLVCALFFVFGLTASGWNGAFLAEVAQLSPPAAIATATGGSLFFVNVGKFCGPILFTNAYFLAGSYKTAFALLAVPSALALACLLAARGSRAPRPAPVPD
jgi:predicted MFS family arabinose efflux permease